MMITMAFPPPLVVPLPFAGHVSGVELTLFVPLIGASLNCAFVDEPTGRCVSCPSKLSTWVGRETAA
jgi:hypothetical protein